MIAVMNQKGGVGKTTTTMNVSHALAQTGQRVLAIDLDPQAHLTAGFGLVRKPQPGMAEVMLGEKSADEVVVLARDNMDLLPAGDRLGELEHLNEGGSKRGWLLRDALQDFADEYDYILVDCPPSSGILGMNALLAAKEVLIPVSGDFFALQGLARLMSIFQHIESSLKL
ncbi:MAG: AAA family ATPase, partial [Thioalkalispiraceae bacterium]